jgi:hypothetical protein
VAEEGNNAQGDSARENDVVEIIEVLQHPMSPLSRLRRCILGAVIPSFDTTECRTLKATIDAPVG